MISDIPLLYYFILDAIKLIQVDGYIHVNPYLLRRSISQRWLGNIIVGISLDRLEELHLPSKLQLILESLYFDYYIRDGKAYSSLSSYYPRWQSLVLPYRPFRTQLDNEDNQS